MVARDRRPDPNPNANPRQAAQRSYREDVAAAKMALERQVTELERSLEASRQEP